LLTDSHISAIGGERKFAYWKTIYCVVGNLHTWPSDTTASDRIFGGKGWNGNDVCENLRDKLPFAAKVD
jgi:hypothetical protein